MARLSVRHVDFNREGEVPSRSRNMDFNEKKKLTSDFLRNIR